MERCKNLNSATGTEEPWENSNFWTEKPQSSHINLVARRRDDVVGPDLALGTILRTKLKTRSSPLNFGAFYSPPQQEGHASYSLFLEEPPSGRRQAFLHRRAADIRLSCALVTDIGISSAS